MSAATIVDSLRQVFGLPRTGSAAVAGVVAAGVGLAVLGLAWLGSELRRAVPALVALLVLPALAYAWTGFYRIDEALVFVRYQAAFVPLVIALPVLGIAFVRARSAGGTLAAVVRASAAFAGIALAVLGPLREGLPPANPFGYLDSSLHRSPAEPVLTAGLVAVLFEGDGRTTPIEWPELPPPAAVAAVRERHGDLAIVRCHAAGGPIPGLRFRTIFFSVEELGASGPEPPFVAILL